MDEKQLWDKYSKLQQSKQFHIGPYYSYQLSQTPRHVLFSLSRYKFALKLIGDQKKILELGCNEGLGTYYLSEFADNVTGIDFDEEAIMWAKENLESTKLTFIHDNFLEKKYGEFDAIVTYDVVEHIYQNNEDLFFKTILTNLNDYGILIIGTPNIECSKYSNQEIAGAHVNMYSGDRLVKTLQRYFNNVFLFSQNDEIIHTGFFHTANYLICLCCSKKEML